MSDEEARAELKRLDEDARRAADWKRFGPYLAERQWGTVREDYSPDGELWGYFPHDQARSRAYRWGEDGLLGVCDRGGRMCFALALWNGRDAILKERLFGLSGKEGNHGEDVKEEYFYVDSTPTHSYMRALYKYPQRAFPYDDLVAENRSRGRGEPEYELRDTGAFDGERYFDVQIEYAKAAPNDLLIAVTITNRGPEPAPLWVLPTLWFHNTWAWGRSGGEGYWPKPRIAAAGPGRIEAAHESLGRFVLAAEAAPDAPEAPPFLFTDNESNARRLWGPRAPGEPDPPFAKDAFGSYVVDGDTTAVNPAGEGTKAAAVYRLLIPAGAQLRLRLRLFPSSSSSSSSSPSSSPSSSSPAPFADFEAILTARHREADAFYAGKVVGCTPEQRNVVRQAYAGLCWSKQFYHYDVRAWLTGDPAYPPPPPERRFGRNADWHHVYNRDVLSMPDKWEYPWFAAWDLAFHMLPFARIDPAFAKEQLVLLTREWYMHPNGQLPAYELALGDVNPPVHAWAAWRTYKIAVDEHGHRDRHFLARVFQKLSLNFTWWVNRKDAGGRNLFSGGFLGLDNVGVFDRSRPPPVAGRLEQADGTAWMAFYAATMLSMALELARHDVAYEDMASKFFEHFVAIADAINNLGSSGLWDEQDGFYYDELHVEGHEIPLRARSMVGLLPLIAVEVLDDELVRRLPAFQKRTRWFLENRKDLAAQVTLSGGGHGGAGGKLLLAIPSRARLERVLRRMLDEQEFLSPFGIRSLSKVHARAPFVLPVGDGHELHVTYVPGESDSGLFGGNSNWRGPVWFPVNYLIVEALERYHHFYGDDLRVECPTGSGRMMNLGQVARELSARLARLFLPGEGGARPCHGDDARFARDPAWRDLVLFHEYFHGETGRGLGASHQTGWTALVIRLIEDLARSSG